MRGASSAAWACCCSYMAWKLISARCTGGKPARVMMSATLRAQVRVHDLRAGDAHDGAHLVFGDVADFENAGLLGFDQKHGLVLDLGLHRGGHRPLQRCLRPRAWLPHRAGCPRWAALARAGCRANWAAPATCFLEVDALNLEHGVFLVGHGWGAPVGLKDDEKTRHGLSCRASGLRNQRRIISGAGRGAREPGVRCNWRRLNGRRQHEAPVRPGRSSAIRSSHARPRGWRR
jgi:hypothetical protein